MSLKELSYELIVNIALLALIANGLSRLQSVQNMMMKEWRTWKEDLRLSLVFGGLIIFSTWIGIDVGAYDLNTRVIGALSAGILGGPLVGLYSSIIGALYVLIFSTPQVFAKGAAFATILIGLLGAGFYPYFQRGKWKYTDLFLLGCFAGACEMAALLRMTVSLQVALETVLDMTLPMVLVNAVGIVVFIANFNTVFIRQDLESSRQLQKMSELLKKSLPLLNDGLYIKENVHQLISTILEETDWAGVIITDQEKVLEWQAKGQTYALTEDGTVPEIGKTAMREKRLVEMQQVVMESPWHEVINDYTVVAAPFLVRDQVVGCMIVRMKKQWVERQSEVELLQNFVTIGSLQMAVLELERQKTMLQKAEFKALQFQVNPHFLFNALNTISCVCRENSERARELLVILAKYFRYNLDYEAYMVPLEEELDHVRNYLEIEKARFEDKLTVTYDVPEKIDIFVPTLILQPIVENAVRHGIDKKGRRDVFVEIRDEEDAYVVNIRDKGQGFSEEIIEKLQKGEAIGSSIGLSNVHKRMKSIYGEDRGLKINSSKEGSTVELRFFKEGGTV